MKTIILLVLIVLVVAGGLGYWRGWFGVNNVGTVGIQIDPEKFKKDRDDFSRSVTEKAKAMRDKVDDLWKKTEATPGDNSTAIQKDLGELKQKHDQLVQKLKDLEDTSHDKFEKSKLELSNSLDAVDKKIEELTRKLETGKAK